MQRSAVSPRHNLEDRIRDTGFAFATIDGAPYWDESACYRFTLSEIEDDLEAPTNELAALCLDLVDRACRDERLLDRLAIPGHAWPLVVESWRRRDASLYGRFDLAYDGHGPAKLLEYNADTPTALFEASVFQWDWLEDAMAQGLVARGADQFNSLHEALIATLKDIATAARQGELHLACMPDSVEDQGLVTYLADCAAQAGLSPHLLAIADLGTTGRGPFVDLDNAPVHLLFKLYPWEWMFRDSFIASPSMQVTRFLEPPWKAILSSKAILPLLWAMAPGHPNLLPAYFEDDPKRAELAGRYARKPIHSREGANISLVDGARTLEASDGPYDSGPAVLQALAPLPDFDGNFPVIGSWIVGSAAHGIGIREDRSRITRDTSRFVPHVIAS